jgi:hypothetical protein
VEDEALALEDNHTAQRYLTLRPSNKIMVTIGLDWC